MFLSPALCLGYMNRQTQGQPLETHIFYNFRVGQGALACFVFHLSPEYLSFLVGSENSDGQQQWHRRGHAGTERDHAERGDDTEVETYQEIWEANLGNIGESPSKCWQIVCISRRGTGSTMKNARQFTTRIWGTKSSLLWGKTEWSLIRAVDFRQFKVI